MLQDVTYVGLHLRFSLRGGGNSDDCQIKGGGGKDHSSTLALL